ncbi:pentatricopeptide (PPR) repeat protein, partial [Trifolium pratense]
MHFHHHVVAYGFVLNQVSYGTLIDGFCKIGKTRAALQVLRQLKWKSVKPSVVMYTTIIDTMCKDKLVRVGQLEEAIGLLNEMVVLRKLKADVYILNILLDALCKEGKVKEAKIVLAMMMKQGVQPDNGWGESLMLESFLKRRMIEVNLP